MGIQFNIYGIVLLFAFVQGIFYIILFIKRGIQEERQSDFWMAAVIAALCISNLGSMLGFMGIYILGQQLWFFPHSTGLVIGPIFYYYLKTQINTDFKFSKQGFKDFKHFIPYILYFIYHLSIFLMGKNIENWWVGVVHNPLYIGDCINCAEIISLCLYTVLAVQLYRQYLDWLPKERSDTEGVRFDWYKNFLWAIIGGVVVALITFAIGFWIELSYWDDWIQRAVVAVIIYFISFAGYVQMQPRHIVFNEKAVEKAGIAENLPSLVIEKRPAESLKTENKTDNIELKKWQTKIEYIMINEKLYLNPELTLSELSEKLDSHNSLVSNVINTQFQKNFNDFVNEFRVNIFKEKIKDPKLQHLTLLAIAFDCGFNSKSTFNRAVKKMTGEMPSAFLK
jgi:AraC-like DNA-binding protein